MDYEIKALWDFTAVGRRKADGKILRALQMKATNPRLRLSEAVGLFALNTILYASTLTKPTSYSLAH